MEAKIIILAAVAPAFVLCWYIYRRDKYQKEPVSQLIKGFLYGVVAVLIAAPLEMIVEMLGIVDSAATSWLGQTWHAFAGVAIIEEGAKLLMLWLLLRRNKYYDEMMDGVVYAAMVGMGFAAAENITYLFGNLDSWMSVAVGRAIFSVPGHFMFAVAMGYYYSLNHFTTLSHRSRVLWVPVLLHGIFDALLMISSVSPEWSGVIMLIFVVFCCCLPRMAKRKINSLLESDAEQHILKLEWTD